MRSCVLCTVHAPPFSSLSSHPPLCFPHLLGLRLQNLRSCLNPCALWAPAFHSSENTNPSQEGVAAACFLSRAGTVGAEYLMAMGRGKCPVARLYNEHLKYMPLDSDLLLVGMDATDLLRQESSQMSKCHIQHCFFFF